MHSRQSQQFTHAVGLLQVEKGLVVGCSEKCPVSKPLPLDVHVGDAVHKREMHQRSTSLGRGPQLGEEQQSQECGRQHIDLYTHFPTFFRSAKPPYCDACVQQRDVDVVNRFIKIVHEAMHTSEVAKINPENGDGVRVEASPLDDSCLGRVAFVDGANSKKQLGCAESGIFQSGFEAKTNVGARD